jgi:Ulp1 family protease
MSEQDLVHLVEKIVLRVMERLQADDQLASLIKDSNIDKSKWARTCSTYRHEETTTAPNKAVEIKTPAVNKVHVTSKKLYTERDMIELANAGHKVLLITKQTILTPSAKDAAKAKGIEIKVD